jgi:hypothetical protein
MIVIVGIATLTPPAVPHILAIPSTMNKFILTTGVAVAAASGDNDYCYVTYTPTVVIIFTNIIISITLKLPPPQLVLLC